MHILTIMDYADTNSVAMCKSWIIFAKRFNPHTQITIFSTREISEIRAFASRFPSINFRRLAIPTRARHLTGGKTHHPAQELQLSLWLETAKLGIYRYLYVDADALILGSLQNWWKHIDDKPYIGIAECKLPDGGLQCNAGVYSYSSPNGFITFDKLFNQYIRDNRNIRYYSGQQGLLNAYFQHIQYDFTHPNIGHEYNSIARFCKVIRLDENNIEVWSGRYPMIKSFSDRLLHKTGDWTANWLWWNKPRPVKILHAFGEGLKFWELPECRSLWQYCVNLSI